MGRPGACEDDNISTQWSFVSTVDEAVRARRGCGMVHTSIVITELFLLKTRTILVPSGMAVLSVLTPQKYHCSSI